jgi:hypothetical protein
MVSYSTKRYHERKKDPVWWAKRQAWNKQNAKKNWPAVLEYRNKLAREKRLKAFTHYSGGTPKCNCCGETEPLFLTLDHVNGGGRKERKKLGAHLYFYYTLEKRNYPAEYQVLCMNCNLGRHKNGGVCPHRSTSS